jgi:hypothetical protein
MAGRGTYRSGMFWWALGRAESRAGAAPAEVSISPVTLFYNRRRRWRSAAFRSRRGSK